MCIVKSVSLSTDDVRIGYIFGAMTREVEVRAEVLFVGDVFAVAGSEDYVRGRDVRRTFPRYRKIQPDTSFSRGESTTARPSAGGGMLGVFSLSTQECDIFSVCAETRGTLNIYKCRGDWRRIYLA